MNASSCSPTNTIAAAPSTTATPIEPRVQFRPAVDVIETPEAVLLRADLPGVKPEAVDVTFEDGVLTIAGKIDPRGPASGRFLLREYGVGDFARSLRLGPGIDSGKIAAELKGGVLTLTLPKAEAVKPRKIAVRTN